MMLLITFAGWRKRRAVVGHRRPSARHRPSTPRPPTTHRRPPSALAALLAALVGLTGCDLLRDEPTPERSAAAPQSSPSAAPAGSSTHTLLVDGRDRTYRLYRPASLGQTGPVPLVVMLHGALGTGSQAESSYGWTAEADRGGFVVAFPDGLNRAWAVAPGCCGPPAREGVDDVAFIGAMVGAIAAALPVDTARTYVTGISNGGLLAYRLACDTTLFAAVGVVAATLAGDCPDPAPLSVLHIQGRRDETMPYGGGPGRRDNDGTGRNPVKIDGPPVPELVARWRSVAGCAEPTVGTTGPVTRSAATCPDGRAVELITIADAGHQWPGGTVNPRIQRLLNLDPPSTALNATDTIWRFFRDHPRPTGG
jgi:polyhydroxybutyrate depolymerase